MEILSWLEVKPLLRFVLVCKWFRWLIKDPFFIELHLQKSPRGSTFLFRYRYTDHTLNYYTLVFSCSRCSLLDNTLLSRTVNLVNSTFDLENDKYEVAGSCNGLVCLVAEDNTGPTHALMHRCIFYLWNPATRKIFEVTQYLFEVNLHVNDLFVIFGFGYDNISYIYKVVTLVFTLSLEDGSLKSCYLNICGTNVNDNWRSIQGFPANPNTVQESGVYLNNTLVWVASTRDDEDVWTTTFYEWAIISLDLDDEKYTELLLPPNLDDIYVGHRVPSIAVLEDCLSISFYNSKTHHFMVWQMKEFMNQKSWIPLLNVQLQDLQIGTIMGYLEPLCVFDYGSVLLIYYTTYYCELRAIVYHVRDNIVQHCEISSDRLSVSLQNYVESLVSPEDIR